MKLLSFKTFIAAMALSTAAISHAGNLSDPTITMKGLNDYCKAGVSTQICSPSSSIEHNGSLAELKNVNFEVNRKLKFTVEEPGKDEWRLPTDGTGDCEDYVLAKVQKLLALGWNSNDLRIGVMKNDEGYHAVLVATVDNVSYYLDSYYSDVKPTTSRLKDDMEWERIQVPGTRLFVKYNGKN